MKKLPKKIQRWVDALRSGKYKQGRKALCIIGSGENKFYCCLGVYLEANYPEIPTQVVNGKIVSYTFNEAEFSRLLPPEIGDQVLPPCTSNQNNLALRNDSGETFSDIADYIEEIWKNDRS